MKTNKRLTVTILVFIIYMLTNFHRPAITVISDLLIRDFGLTSVSFGFLGLVFMLTYALMQFPLGALNDTWGPRKVILICLVITTVGSFIFGISNTYAVLIVSRILVAIGISGFSVSGAKLLAEWFEQKRFGRLWGLFMGWGVMGSVLATRPLVMLTNSVGWKVSFIIIGLISAVILIFAYFIVDSPAKDIVATTGSQKVAGAVEITSKEVKNSGWDNFIAAVSRCETWLVVIYFIGVNSSGQVLCSLWGGVFLKTVYGFNESTAANILMVSAICMIFGSLLSGFVKPQKGMISGSFAFLAIWLVITLGMQSLSLPVVYVVFALIGFIQFWAVVAGFVFLRKVTSPAIYGTVYGFANGGAWILGTGAFQQIWGFILQSGTDKVKLFQVAMGGQLVVLALSCISAIILANKRKDLELNQQF